MLSIGHILGSTNGVLETSSELHEAGVQQALTWVDNTLIGLGWGVLVVAAAVWISRHRDPLHGAPPRPNHLDLMMVWLCLLMFVASAAIGTPLAGLFLPSGMDPQEAEVSRSLIASNISQIMVAATGLVIAHLTFRQGLRGFGFRFRPWRVVAGFAVGGWIVASGVCMTIGMIMEELFRLFRPWLEFETPLHPVIESLADFELPIVIRVFAATGALVLAPLGEEIFYRGIVQTSLQKIAATRLGSMRHRWFAVCVTGVVFGAMHTATPQHIPALAVLGIILGFVYERTGSLIAPIMLHMLFNGKTLLWLGLLTRYGAGVQ